MSTHVIKSTVVPTVAPTSKQLGTHWIKTTDPVGHWLATNTADAGWVHYPAIHRPAGFCYI